MTKRGWVLFFALGLLWGMPYLLIRIAVGAIDPLVVAGARTLIGALLLLPLALHRNALAAGFRRWKWLLAYTVIEINVSWLLLGHERLESRRLLGLGIGFAGVALLVGIDIHFSELMAAAATQVVATLVYAPFVPFLWPEHVPATAAWSVVGLGILCTATAFMVFFALIAEVGPARATVITYVNPAVAIVLGAVVLSEPLTRQWCPDHSSQMRVM